MQKFGRGIRIGKQEAEPPLPPLQKWNGEPDFGKLCQQVRSGAKAQSEAAFNELVSRVSPDIYRFLHSIYVRGLTRLDIYQECLLALRFKAVEAYESERGPFQAFASVVMKRHVYTLIKNSQNDKQEALNSAIAFGMTPCGIDQKHSGSLGGNVEKNEPDAPDLSAVYPDPRQREPEDEVGERERTSLLWRRLWVTLSPFERDVLNLFCDRLCYDQIAERLAPRHRDRAVDHKAVDNALQRIRKKAEAIAAEIEESDPDRRKEDSCEF